jgi:hypothetical protein
MAMRMTVTDVKEIKAGIWSFEMPPHQVRHFGSSGHAMGSKSVLLFNSYDYDADSHQLHFNLEDVSAINVGTTSTALGIATDFCGEEDGDAKDTDALDPMFFGQGDREFLRLAKLELSVDIAQVAEKLLLGVRQKSAGDLKRGKSRNFSETPDNFWYVILQPRIDEISITVRGAVSHFEPIARLEIKDDRGNTRFKVKSADDLPAALQIIFHAIRKK